MTDINLLSPERLEALNGRILYSFIERFMISAVIAVLLSSVLLLGVKIQLTKNLNDIQSRQILSTDYVAVNKDIARLNSSISKIENIQKEVIPASKLIEDVVIRTPSGVLITSMNFETLTRSMRINGHADTREQVLAYEGNLLESPFIENLDSPVSNLFKKTDLLFTFQAVLDTERLKQELEPQKDES